MNDWNIQSRAHQCQSCDHPFQDKQAYHTLLLDEQQSYVRRDICDACWQMDFREQEREKAFISYWHGVYEAPPAAPPEPIQKENAESLLRKLIELNKPEFSAAGYILAVMLERKRLLKIKEQIRREDRRVFVYEHPKSGDLFTVTDPALELNQLEEVQRTVGALMEFGLTPEGDIAWPPEPEPPSPSDAMASDDSEPEESDSDTENVPTSEGAATAS